jgi:hypothetical protein
MGEILGSIVELALYGTGEALLWVLTLGRRTPRWPYEGTGSSVLEGLLVEGSTWLGFLFWAGVIAAVAFFTLGVGT